MRFRSGAISVSPAQVEGKQGTREPNWVFATRVTVSMDFSTPLE
jgi:hypothetical protein